MPGLVNVDFADVRTIMSGAGTSLMGQGVAIGRDRAREAASRAIQSPLLEVGIERATGIVWNITGPADMTLFEVSWSRQAVWSLGAAWGWGVAAPAVAAGAAPAWGAVRRPLAPGALPRAPPDHVTSALHRTIARLTTHPNTHTHTHTPHTPHTHATHTARQVNEAAEIVYDLVDPEANLIFGAVIDPTITSGEVSITLIATGFGGTSREQLQAQAQARGGYAMAAASNGSSNGGSAAAVAAATVAAPSRAGLAPVPVEKPPAAQPRIRDDVPELGIEIPAFLRKRRARGQ